MTYDEKNVFDRGNQMVAGTISFPHCLIKNMVEVTYDFKLCINLECASIIINIRVICSDKSYMCIAYGSEIYNHISDSLKSLPLIKLPLKTILFLT